MVKKNPERLRISLISIMLFLCVFFLYSGVRNHEFINYDDPGYIINNSHIRHLSPGNIFWAFKTCHMSNWHPLTWISHMIDFRLFGLDPGLHHLMNVFFHSVNGVLLFLVLLLMNPFKPGKVLLCGFIAGIFTLHPLRVESVAWASERKDVLSALFWLLSMVFYIRYTKTGSLSRYFCSFFLFLAGLLSKPMVLTLPFALLLLDFWPLNRLNGKSFLKLIYEKIPFFAAAAVSSAVTLYAQKQGGAVIMDIAILPMSVRIESAAAACFYYITKFFRPLDLAVFYPYEPFSMLILVPAFSLITLITILSLAYREKRPWLLAGWLFFLGTLVPVIGLVQVGKQFMADRYTYIPHMGLLIMVWGELAFFTGNIKKFILICSGTILLLILSFLSYRQLGFWKNSVTLFSHALITAKPNFIAYNNLGTAYSDKGDIKKAIPCFEKAIEISPSNDTSLYNLGYNYYKLGNYPEALKYLAKASELNPKFYQAYNISGIIYFKTGKFAQAREQILEFIKLVPDHPSAVYYLVLCDLRLNQKEEALKYYEKLKSLNPSLAGKVQFK